MPAVDPVILQLRVEAQQYKRQLESTTLVLENQIDKQERAIANLSSEFKRSGGAISGFFDTLRNAVSGIAIAAAAREVLKYAEAYKGVEAQLRLATKAFGSFNQAEADAARLAADTRSGLVETATLYGNFIRATQTLGGTQEQAARATETFSKALKIGGADTNAAASATLQFGQALASGALRGDEFNSIAEASPRILQLLADALGKPRGELRKLAEDGKLTSDVLFKALTDRKFTAGIDEEFKTLPVTFGDAMQQVENAATITFGAFDRGGEFSKALASFVLDGANGFNDLAASAEQTGADIRATFFALSNVFEPMVSGAASAFAQIGIDHRSIVQQIRDDIVSILRLYDRANNIVIGIGNAATRFDNGAKRVLNRAIGRAGGTVFFDERATQAESDLAGQFERDFATSQAAARRRARTRRSVGAVVAPRRPAERVTPAASGAAARGRGRSAATKDVETAAEFVASIRRDLEKITRDTGSFILSETDRLRQESQRFRDIFGDQPDTIGDAVAASDQNVRAELDARNEAENRAQDLREANVRSLASLYEDLFQQGTAGVWENFKDQGLRALALILAQATVTSFASGGGGFGSLLGNIGKAVAGSGGLGGLFGRASGGYVGPGQTVRVNEQRPGVELLRMGPQGGTVIPLGQAAAARPSATTIVNAPQFNLKGAVVTRELYADMQRISNQSASLAGQAAYKQAMRDAPAAVGRANRFGTSV